MVLPDFLAQGLSQILVTMLAGAAVTGMFDWVGRVLFQDGSFNVMGRWLLLVGWLNSSLLGCLGAWQLASLEQGIQLEKKGQVGVASFITSVGSHTASLPP